MKLSLSLREPIDCNVLCHKIHNLIQSYQGSLDINNSLLIIDIVNISQEINPSQLYIEDKTVSPNLS